MTSLDAPRYRPWLHAYGIALAVCTFLLLFAGGMVTSTNSGLSVPDWPTTFGRNMFLFPPSMMKGGIFYEHGHRLFASLVGFLTVGNCLALGFAERRRWLKWTGAFGLLLVITQGVLGGLTVKFKLPMPVSAAHACTAELFFALTVLMAFATSRAWLTAGESRPWARREPLLALAFCLAAFAQIAVGAVMRHSYAGLAIPTFPRAYGEWIPPFWNFPIAVHFLHSRVGASALVILGAALIAAVLASREAPVLARRLAVFLGFALALQITLGIFTIWSAKAPVPTTFHLSGGALVFATGWLLFLALCRLPARRGSAEPVPARRAVAANGVAAA
jgi:cytochrome c oxidase assembly protein subunit 15